MSKEKGREAGETTDMHTDNHLKQINLSETYSQYH